MMGMGGQMGLKQPVPQRPNQKPGAHMRPGDDEEERYWNHKRKNQGKGREDPKRADVARSPEAEFFSKCRNRMPKPLYLELLKCLNLYSQQIVDRPELLTLVHDLFKRSQIELFANFRRLLGYSGAGGDQERIPSPPPASNAPQAEGGNFRDLDFSLMRRHGTSYRILPDSYIMPATSGRGPLETLVLNDAWVSVATGTEDLNFKTMRKNQYEESIFRAEDERFELDTTIETNMHTIQYLQPISVEIANLSEQEKRRYKLPSPLSAMHQKSIRRLYGPQGNQVIELLQKCPAAAVGALLKRLQQKDEEWRALRAQCSKTWKEVYEKNYTKSLDHRSFYFKQGDKKNFSGKQMVQEVKQLTETPEEGEGGASGAAGSSSNANAAASSNNGQSASDGASTSSAALCLPFTVRHAPLSTLHDDTLELMTFAAKLNFSVFEGEIEDKLVNFWKGFVRTFFVCPDQKVADGAAAPAADDSMDVDDGASADGVRCKPLLIVAPGDGETEATRDARPPEQRWTMPMQYPKTSAQLFLGNSHFYIFTRLYHVIAMRLDAARGMAAAAQASAETAAEANGDDKATAAATAVNSNGIAAAASVADGGASADQMSRASLLAQIRADCKGDLYVAFTSCLKQLIDGKMEASTYEDVMRTLLGTNAYLLFTLHKIIAQALKQLQMILVEETSQRLLDLYHYERQRAAAGSFAEATYRSNARMMLEGDDCFSMEQLYSSGDPNSNGEDGLGGGLWLAFLPEKEDDDDDDVEVEEDDDEDEGDEAGKAQTVAYMRSFMQRARSTASLPKGSKGALLLKRRLRSPRKPVWGKAMLSNGLECRSTVGSCKLRFVARSEDVWFIAAACGAKPAGGKKKRGGGGGGGGGKRRKLASVLEGKGSKDGPNVLSGLGAAKMAPLPKQHVLKPLPETTAAAASGSS
jgi:paired amphipathic helix protein Sin3a